VKETGELLAFTSRAVHAGKRGENWRPSAVYSSRTSLYGTVPWVGIVEMERQNIKAKGVETLGNKQRNAVTVHKKVDTKESRARYTRNGSV
jgi:hypothetical protein